MRKVTVIVSFVFANHVSFAQKTFSDCFDTLQQRFTGGTSLKRDPIAEWQNCVIGKEMPFLTVQTISGEKIETKDLKGKVIVINLWFTTCYPCILELPALNRLVEEYKDKDVVFLGISKDTRAMLETDFFPKYKFDFKIIADGNDIIKKIGRTAFPTFYIIDTNGKVRDAWSGGAIDKTAETEVYLKAKPIIDELLKTE